MFLKLSNNIHYTVCSLFVPDPHVRRMLYMFREMMVVMRDLKLIFLVEELDFVPSVEELICVHLYFCRGDMPNKAKLVAFSVAIWHLMLRSHIRSWCLLQD